MSFDFEIYENDVGTIYLVAKDAKNDTYVHGGYELHNGELAGRVVELMRGSNPIEFMWSGNHLRNIGGSSHRGIEITERDIEVMRTEGDGFRKVASYVADEGNLSILWDNMPPEANSFYEINLILDELRGLDDYPVGGELVGCDKKYSMVIVSTDNPDSMESVWDGDLEGVVSGDTVAELRVNYSSRVAPHILAYDDLQFYLHKNDDGVGIGEGVLDFNQVEYMITVAEQTERINMYPHMLVEVFEEYSPDKAGESEISLFVLARKSENETYKIIYGHTGYENNPGRLSDDIQTMLAGNSPLVTPGDWPNGIREDGNFPARGHFDVVSKYRHLNANEEPFFVFDAEHSNISIRREHTYTEYVDDEVRGICVDLQNMFGFLLNPPLQSSQTFTDGIRGKKYAAMLCDCDYIKVEDYDSALGGLDDGYLYQQYNPEEGLLTSIVFGNDASELWRNAGTALWLNEDSAEIFELIDTDSGECVAMGAFDQFSDIQLDIAEHEDRKGANIELNVFELPNGNLALFGTRAGGYDEEDFVVEYDNPAQRADDMSEILSGNYVAARPDVWHGPENLFYDEEHNGESEYNKRLMATAGDSIAYVKLGEQGKFEAQQPENDSLSADQFLAGLAAFFDATAYPVPSTSKYMLFAYAEDKSLVGIYQGNSASELSNKIGEGCAEYMLCDGSHTCALIDSANYYGPTSLLENIHAVDRNNSYAVFEDCVGDLYMFGFEGKDYDNVVSVKGPYKHIEDRDVLPAQDLEMDIHDFMMTSEIEHSDGIAYGRDGFQTPKEFLASVTAMYGAHCICDSDGVKWGDMQFDSTREMFAWCDDGKERLDWIMAVKVEPGKMPRAYALPNTLSAFQKEVGGRIEVVRSGQLPGNAVIICNEEGKLQNLPRNRFLFDVDSKPVDVLHGTFLVVADKGDDFGGLSDYQIRRVLDLYDEPSLSNILDKMIKAGSDRIEAEFKDCPADCFAIYQMRSDKDGADDLRSKRFADYDTIQELTDGVINKDMYHAVYAQTMTGMAGTNVLEDIFIKFNLDLPKDYLGHSLSVSDVIALNQSGKISYYFVDSHGFKALEDFDSHRFDYILNAEKATEEGYSHYDGRINNVKKSSEITQAEF